MSNFGKCLSMSRQLYGKMSSNLSVRVRGYVSQIVSVSSRLSVSTGLMSVSPMQLTLRRGIRQWAGVPAGFQAGFPTRFPTRFPSRPTHANRVLPRVLPGARQTREYSQDTPLKDQLMLAFTCKKCNDRSSHLISKQAYQGGTVLVQCPHCKNRHLIADHLKIFNDKSITIEDILALQGESVGKECQDLVFDELPEKLKEHFQRAKGKTPTTN